MQNVVGQYFCLMRKYHQKWPMIRAQCRVAYLRTRRVRSAEWRVIRDRKHYTVFANLTMRIKQSIQCFLLSDFVFIIRLQIHDKYR